MVLLLDFALLPASIRELDVTGFYIQPVALRTLQCVTLTRLVIEWTSNTLNDLFTLLQHLPSVQVSRLKHVGLSFKSKLSWYHSLVKHQ